MDLRRSGPDRLDPILIAALVISSAILRFYAIDRVPITRDEAFSWRVTQYADGDWLDVVAADTHPPLHFMLLRGWTKAMGDSLASMRSLSACFGVAAVVAAYYVVRSAARMTRDRLSGFSGERLAGLSAAICMAVSPLQIEVSRNARMYSVGSALAAFCAWSLWAALRTDRQRTWRWLVYGLASSALLLTHSFGWFTMAAQWVFIGLAGIFRKSEATDGRSSALTGWLTASAVTFAVYAPWISSFVSQAIAVRQGFWIMNPSAEELAVSFSKWAIGRSVGVLGASMIVVLGTLLWVGAVWHGRWRWQITFFFTQAAVPWILGAVVVLLANRPLFQDRYLTFAQLGLFAGFGMIVRWLSGDRSGEMARAGDRAGLWTPIRRWAAVAVCFAPVLLNLPSALGVLNGPVTPACDYQAASGHLRGRWQPGDVVLVAGAGQLNQLRYYCTRLGWKEVDVKCRRPVVLQGRESHVASLSADDVFDDEKAILNRARVWTVHEGPRAPTAPIVGLRLQEVIPVGEVDGPNGLVVAWKPTSSR
jgi:hypothetical protein